MLECIMYSSSDFINENRGKFEGHPTSLLSTVNRVSINVSVPHAGSTPDTCII